MASIGHPKIVFSKSPIPILWLDTSLLINFAKVRKGLALSNGMGKRIPRLYDLIEKLTRKELILCPKGDQKEEFLRDLSEFRNIEDYLSLGVTFKHRVHIKEAQLYIFMKAYVGKLTDITVDYKNAFYTDPQKTLEETREYGIICARVVNEEMIRIGKAYRDDITNRFEEERKKFQIDREGLKLDTYEKILQYVQQKNYEGFLERIEEYHRKSGELPILFGDKLRQVSYMLARWSKLTEHLVDPGNLTDFIGSEYFKGMPCEDISCKITAKLLEKRTSIKSGDYMDIKQLAALLPYCDIVITDNAMKNILRSLEFERSYRTALFSLSDFDELMSRLESIFI